MQFSVINFAFLIFAAFVLTLAGVEFWRRLALRRNHLDLPNERSSHVTPTPRGGGIIIFIVTVLFLIVWAWQNSVLDEIAPFLLGAFLIAAVSFLDDLYSLPSALRFAVHTVAASIAIYSFGFFGQIDLPFLSKIVFPSFLGQFLTLIWIVGLTNAYNFMDGIDGIAGSQGLIAGLGWCVLGFIVGQPFIAVFGALLAASCGGFLYHNWHPARIFMGDVGSAFLGFSLAVLPLFAARKTESTAISFIIGALFVWTFVFDSTLTFFRRAINGENVFAAHRSHLYQRLVIGGFRHDTVSLLYGFLALIGVGAAIYILLAPEMALILGILPILCAGLFWLVSAREAKFSGGKLQE